MRGYVQLFLLGSGQFGDVYKALAPGNIPVAMKVLKRALDDESSQRELASLELTKSLRHPYLLETHTFWVGDDGRLVIIMQLADGSLLDWFKQCRAEGQPGIPGPELSRYFLQAAEALDFLQRHGLDHRDIKPANLLRVEGFAKVADFGLAKERKTDLQTQTFCGTPGYMAPEAWQNAFGDRSDQYSLAATYAEMRTGTPIFKRDLSFFQYAEQCMKGVPNLEGLSEREQFIVRRALAKDPDERYPNCSEFAQSLAEVWASSSRSRDYRILELIGEGQFSRVYRAAAPGNIEVALKVTKRTLDHADCQREVAALELVRDLNHPYLLKTSAFWADESGRLNIVMEKADESLEDWFKRCTARGLAGIPAGELVPFLQQAALALDYLHSKGRVHRDVKPANLLRLQGYAKVADFGLVRSQGSGVVDATFCGTPLYMAPEGCSSQSSIHSDQYSLAITYAEMRTGKRVFTGRDTFDLFRQHLCAAPNLRGLPRKERKVVARALAKAPAARYRSCAEFTNALEAAIRRDLWRKLARLAVIFLVCVMCITVGGILARMLLSPSSPRPLSKHEDPVRPPVPKPVVVPPPDGFAPIDPQDVVACGDKTYYRRLKYPLPDGKELEFRFIPPNDTPPIPPFYMLRDKVTHGQFQVVLLDRRKQGELDEELLKNPKLGKGFWKDKRVNPDGDPSLPVMGVTFTEAHCFAQRLHVNCRLPTALQWDKAGGRYETRGNPGPFNPKADKKDLALGTGLPRPAGDSVMDESPFGCRDMAANGFEWTADVEGGLPIPVANPKDDLAVTLRGHSFRLNDPYTFGEKLNFPYLEVERDLGFRVVLTLPQY